MNNNNDREDIYVSIHSEYTYNVKDLQIVNTSNVINYQVIITIYNKFMIILYSASMKDTANECASSNELLMFTFGKLLKWSSNWSDPLNCILHMVVSNKFQEW